MDRHWDASGAAAAPPAPVNVLGPNVYPQGGASPSEPGPWWFHMITEELRAVIVAAGETPDRGTLNQLVTALQAQGYNLSLTAGTADAITVAFTPALTAFTSGPIWWRASAANGTTTPTLKRDGLAAKTLVKGNDLPLALNDIPGAGAWMCSQYDATLDKEVVLNPATGVAIVPSSPVRQTVLGGPVDNSGLPSFLPATSVNLSLTSQNIGAGAPLVVSSAGGFGGNGAIDRIGFSTVNLTWNGLTANATNFLYVDVANGTLTPGSTTLQPVYQQGGAPAVTAGQATFNIAQMQMFLGNGAAAPQVYRVFLGEAVTGAGSVTSTVSYAYMGICIVPDTTPLPGVATLVTKNSNIGTTVGVDVRFEIECVTAEFGYSVGDIVSQVSSGNATYDWALSMFKGRNTVGFTTGSNSAFDIPYKGTGVNSIPTSANWKYRITAKRSW